jgi:hypothetical protein
VGWAIGYDDHWQRWIGYGVIAWCDFPRCNEVIDRGLVYVCCDQQPYGGERGCGLYFCDKHHNRVWERCSRCANYRPPFKPKPEHPDWINHLLTDESWAEWRAENPEFVAGAESGVPLEEKNGI